MLGTAGETWKTKVVKGAVLTDCKVDKRKSETVDCSEEVSISVLLFSILN